MHVGAAAAATPVPPARLVQTIYNSTLINIFKVCGAALRLHV